MERRLASDPLLRNKFRQSIVFRILTLLTCHWIDLLWMDLLWICLYIKLSMTLHCFCYETKASYDKGTQYLWNTSFTHPFLLDSVNLYRLTEKIIIVTVLIVFRCIASVEEEKNTRVGCRLNTKKRKNCKNNFCFSVRKIVIYGESLKTALLMTRIFFFGYLQWNRCTYDCTCVRLCKCNAVRRCLSNFNNSEWISTCI